MSALLTPPLDFHPQRLLEGNNVQEPQSLTFERYLSDNELSYFLPSRADGVNDMYIHIGFKSTAASSLLSINRLSILWAILRLRHPLLASKVVMEPFAYSSARFVYSPPSSPQEAIDQARNAVVDKGVLSGDDLVHDYLNGPRSLGNERLSALVISKQPESSSGEDDLNVMFCAVHFIGDGMALHATANDFFTLLTEEGEKPGVPKTEVELEEMLKREWTERHGGGGGEVSFGGEPLKMFIPQSTESRLPEPKNKFQAAAHKIDFKNSEGRLIGGQTFPRSSTKAPRKTRVCTISFDSTTTKSVLKKCKSEGVTISNALFAICNLAWIRTSSSSSSSSSTRELPMMMYSALNLRPYLSPSPITSYWFLSVGYFNVILPTFLPEGKEDRTFWLRAKNAKVQGAKYVKNPMLLSRAQEMAKERGMRARKWAKEDDEKDLAAADTSMANEGLKIDIGSKTKQQSFNPIVLLPTPPASPRMKDSTPPSPFNPRSLLKKARRASRDAFSFFMNAGKRRSMMGSSNNSLPSPPSTPKSESPSSPVVEAPTSPSLTILAPTPSTPAPPKTPSNVLIGLSLLGNLDATYKHASYAPSGVTLHTLVTGSRQRSGGMLLFNYTFAGKLWVNLGWDTMAFKEGAVERFWEEVGKIIEEKLVQAA